LLELREAVEDAVAEAGWTREERAFSAHLTLGRIKSQSGIGKLRQALEKGMDTPVGSMVVDKVSLIQSNLKPSGPVYQTLTTVILRPQDHGVSSS
jgi:2'-5' RNA ligase